MEKNMEGYFKAQSICMLQGRIQDLFMRGANTGGRNIH